jgi:hypothetical protein
LSGDGQPCSIAIDAARRMRRLSCAARPRHRPTTGICADRAAGASPARRAAGSARRLLDGSTEQLTDRREDMRQVMYAFMFATAALAVTACADSQDPPAASDTAGSDEPLDDTGDTAADAVTLEGVTALSADPAGDAADPAAPDVPCPFPNPVITPLHGTCPGGYTCMYQDIHFGGFAVGVVDHCFIPDLRKITCSGCTGGNFNDDASSWKNHSGGKSCWWPDIKRKGTPTVMPNNTQHPQMTPANNDKASSFGSC